MGHLNRPRKTAPAAQSTDLPTPESVDIDLQVYRQALGCFPTGVAIITTLDTAGQPLGLTCNSFSSVSLEPPLVSWNLRSTSRSLEAFRNAGRFAINVLTESQNALSARFASSTIANKFQGIAYTLRPGGSPVIDACVASFECRTVAEHVAGDHSIFIGQVEHHQHTTVDPLVFFRGSYVRLTESLRAFVAQGHVSPDELAETRELLHGSVMRLACERATRQDLDAIERNLQLIETFDPIEQRTERMEAATEFLRLVAAAGHNRVLSVVFESLTQILRYRMADYRPPMRNPEISRIRLEILAQMRNRDADAALAAMRTYLQLARESAHTSLEVVPAIGHVR